MSDKNEPHNDAEEQRIENPKKVNRQIKEIAESSDDDDPRPGLARDRQSKPEKADKSGK